MTDKTLILQLELGQMANFSYLIGDTASGTAAVVDPHDDTASIDAAAGKAGLTIAMVLLTHGHYDHVGGVGHYDKQGLSTHLSAKEFPLYIPRCKNLKRINDGDKIQVGKLSVECLHTPGHTPGGICYLADGNLITGDTLFVDAVGRADLPGGNASILFQSLQRIKALPGTTIIWPGHNYGAVTHAALETLKTTNPYLACTSTNAFSNL